MSDTRSRAIGLCEPVGRKMPTHTFFSPIGVPFLLMSNPPSPALSVIALTESIRLSVTCRRALAVRAISSSSRHQRRRSVSTSISRSMWRNPAWPHPSPADA
jgi:hypothetical protein